MKNTITSLRQGAEQYRAEPNAWQITRNIDGQYRLAFTHEPPASGRWENVVLRDGTTKIYKTTDAVFTDINRVIDCATCRAVIFYEG